MRPLTKQPSFPNASSSLHLGLAIASVLSIGTYAVRPAEAAQYVLDFESDYSDVVEISEKKDQPLVLFNSNCNGNGSTQFDVECTGGDDDLATGDLFGTDPQGNVLIIQEKGVDPSEPDDSTKGGTVVFDFLEGEVNLDEVAMLDLEDGNPDLEKVTFSGYLEGELIEQVTAAELMESGDAELLSSVEGDNSLYRFGIGFEGVDRLEVKYRGSAAIAFVSWEDEQKRDIPEPTSFLSLLAVGMLGIGSLKRQRPL